MSIRKIPISIPSLGDDEWNALREPIQTGWLTQGPKVRAFEDFFAERHKVQVALATTSCTTGLHLILAAMNIGPGDEVIVPSFTWVATANAVLYQGAKPVLVDIDLKTFNISPAAVKAAITTKTKAIIAVHLFGLPADMDELKSVAGQIPIIEDAACAAGSEYKGVPAGALGIAAAFSFHPRKSVTTGEGGMVTTNDAKLGEVMTMLRNHGAAISEEERHHGPKPYILPQFAFLGFNYRMTDLQGAVGLVQIKKLDHFIDERNRWAQFYSDRLSRVEWLRTPQAPSHVRHGWQSYVCLVNEKIAPKARNEIMEYLHQKGISTRPGTHAIHMLDYYTKNFGFRPETYPNSKAAADLSMAIPLHNKMNAEDYQYVVDTILALD